MNIKLVAPRHSTRQPTEDGNQHPRSGTHDRSGTPIIYIEVEKTLASGLNCYEIATVLLYYNTLPIHRPAHYTLHLLVNDGAQLTFLDTIESTLQLLDGHLKLSAIFVSGAYDHATEPGGGGAPKPAKEFLRPAGVRIRYLNNETIKNFIGTDNLPIQCCGFYVHDQRDVESSMRSVNGASITATGNTGNGCEPHGDQDIINGRLAEVIAIYGEVDRAARKLEQLTEQRRERLREMTRQRALDDEINEVICWMRNEGEQSLRTFGEPGALECPEAAKECEQQFEQFYYVARKHLGKGRDLCDASGELEIMRDNLKLLKDCVDEFQERLERVRERIEGAARLHSLLGMQQLKLDDDIRTEMLKLAEKIDAPVRLIERCRRLVPCDPPHDSTTAEDISTSELSNGSNGSSAHNQHFLNHQNGSSVSSSNKSNNNNNNNNNNNSTSDNISLDISMSDDTITATSTPEKGKFGQSTTSPPPPPPQPPHSLPTLAEQTDDAPHHHHSQGQGTTTTTNRHQRSQNHHQHHHHHHHHHHHRPDEEDEELSKLADSGLGGCDRCEGNAKLERTCSCQSFEDAKNVCNNSDDLDEDCFEGISKPPLDLQIPLQANAHLYCHASNLQLDYEENNPFDQKTQKTLLLIMREMIGTERDYVRSLQYVIENYTQELLREDIPQALRGQRNVIFGNIERICEFHRQHFLSELESCEHHPLKVGTAFLRHESKFYLYALYNKNKPKSDSLMSENGTQFFKAKQIELNDKMDLASYLLKPVQRMGKYALLLQQLMKACADIQQHTNSNPEILEDLEMLQKAEEMVRFQLRHGNDLLAMDSLRDCDVNVKEQGRLLRQNEFLVWEGKAGKKSLRQVFLFEELVLFSKARRFPDRKNLDIYIYKNSIKTSDIGLTAHVGDSPYRFEIWFRKRKPGDTWTLQTMSEDVKNAWTEEISKLLWKQAKRNREIRLAEMSSMGIGSKPCLDIRPSQDQINDRSISISQLGKESGIIADISLSPDEVLDNPHWPHHLHHHHHNLPKHHTNLKKTHSLASSGPVSLPSSLSVAPAALDGTTKLEDNKSPDAMTTAKTTVETTDNTITVHL
uniref:DH domain-containing protein n=1 Tax=Anopheles farauti TaxID=69004 RepID=A0A182R0Z4_9DIPT